MKTEEHKDISAASQESAGTKNYRSIFKATSLFGGVQVYQILIQIIKSKILAVLLGPSGIGIQGLFQSALDLVKQGSSMGIAQSAVRDVAEAHGSGDVDRINETVSILRKIVWWGHPPTKKKKRLIQKLKRGGRGSKGKNKHKNT